MGCVKPMNKAVGAWTVEQIAGRFFGELRDPYIRHYKPHPTGFKEVGLNIEDYPEGIN